jgi:SRSO17 transposase
MVSVSDAATLRPALNDYLDEFSDCIKTFPSKGHLATYVSGQIGPLERKTVEGIALEAGESPRTLQQFLGMYRWNEDSLAERVRHRIRDRHSDDNGVYVVDETGCPKAGDSTVGVQHQYCGRSGKVDNCVVTVGLGYVSKDFYSLLDTELFLPEDTWGTSKALREQAGIPDDVLYRPKWVIACELVERSKADGVRAGWLTGDALYGRCAEFRNRISSAGVKYVVEVPKGLFGWTKRPKVEEEGTVLESGKTLKNARVAPGEKEARRADKLWERGGPTRTLFRVKDTTKGPQVWEVRWTRFHAREDDLPGPELLLVIARNVITGEVKYFLSNAIDETPIGTLLFVAFTRWHIEKIFKESKGRVGFDHFEVRTYLAVKRHLILSAVSLLFLVEQSQRLKKTSPLWTVPQVTMAIEAQLDDDLSRAERRRQVEKTVRKINYYQRRYAVASDCHDETQRRKLHDVGIDLRSVPRCSPPWDIAAA